MKNSKKFFGLGILFLSVMVFSMIGVTASVVSMPEVYGIADDSVEIEAKYKKAATNRITFNANGGKIGTKKSVVTNIRKGSKINRLPATPKRTGYTFKGWYSKKSGGTKISADTKPSKSIILYAQWTKKKQVNKNIDLKLVGRWRKVMDLTGPERYYFHADGRFHYIEHAGSVKSGSYKASGGKITFTNIVWNTADKKNINYPTPTVAEYRFEKNDNQKELLHIAVLDYTDRNYLPLDLAYRWVDYS